MLKYDKAYNLKVNGERLTKAQEYCKSKSISLPMELRKVIDEFYEEQIKEKGE